MSIDKPSLKQVQFKILGWIVSIRIGIKDNGFCGIQIVNGETDMNTGEAKVVQHKGGGVSDHISRKPSWFQDIYRNKIESGKRDWIKERAEQNRKEAGTK